MLVTPHEEYCFFFLDDSMVVGIKGGIGTSACGCSEFLKATYHAIVWFHNFL